MRDELLVKLFLHFRELIAAEKAYKRKQKKLKQLADSRHQEAKLDLLSVFEYNLSSPERGTDTPTSSRKVSPAVMMMGNHLLTPDRRSVTPSRSRKVSSASSMLGDRLPKINH